MKVLILGDIVGRPGRNFLKDQLEHFKQTNQIELIIANGENAAGGAGITAKTAKEILGSGVDAITLGDHVWDQMNFNREIDDLQYVCRPANLPDSNPGRDRLIIEKGGLKIGIFTVLGRTFMGPKVSCPFQTASKMVQDLDAKQILLSQKFMRKQLPKKRLWDGTWMARYPWSLAPIPMFPLRMGEF